ncbi:uncharacterized protein SCHCODRAFT_02671746 [Schizophyllum commune H4-8]|nr:uncharacterized protein SCHCODRAFT_02671746 [Schizophyllum commune H4-8]KAI5887784.1 hypothetical protein SCHCODRAFT_02671746 [Schizophyllum commune H4-8]
MAKKRCSGRRASKMMLDESRDCHQEHASQRATSRPADAREPQCKTASPYRDADVLQHLRGYYMTYHKAHRPKGFVDHVPYHAKFPPAEVLFSGASTDVSPS